MISRYGRISRRAKLDELTKKLASWSNAMVVPLMQTVMNEQDRLGRLGLTEYATAEPATLFRGPDNPGDLSLFVASGPSHDQVDSLARGKGPRYETLLKAHRELRSLLARVQKQEQPFQRVYDMVENLRDRSGGAIAPFALASEVLHPPAELRVRATLMRCELALIADALHCVVARKRWSVPARNFAPAIEACDELRRMAEAAVAPRQRAEADFFAARYILLADGAGTEEERARQVDSALSRLDRAAAVVAEYPGSTAGLEIEIETLRNAVTGREFYSPITTQEMRQVYEAMEREFEGTGSVESSANVGFC
jgi:hypothetical protein